MFTNKVSSKKIITFWAFMCRCGRQRLVNHCTWEVARVTQGRLSSWAPPCLTRPSIDSIWKVKNWTKGGSIGVDSSVYSYRRWPRTMVTKLNIQNFAIFLPLQLLLLLLLLTAAACWCELAHKATQVLMLHTKQLWPPQYNTIQSNPDQSQSTQSNSAGKLQPFLMLRLHEQNKRHKAHVWKE